MGLKTPVTGSISLTTTPVEITSLNYAFHHIKLFLTFTLASGDSYEIAVYSYDPITTNFVRQNSDIISFETVGNTTDPTKQDKTWEMNPTPGSGAKLVITKLTGNNGTANYEIIQIT